MCGPDTSAGCHPPASRSGRYARCRRRRRTSSAPENRNPDAVRTSCRARARTSRASRRCRPPRPGSALCASGACTNIYREEEHGMYTADAKRLTAAGAKKIMTTAIARAQEAGIAVSVAIVDAGGHLLLLERMEGGRFHTVHSATTKAVCAASTRRSTGSKGAQGQDLDTVHALGLALAAGPE